MSRARILIVDDDVAFRDMLARILEEDYDVVTALSGSQGVAEIEAGAGKVDLVIANLGTGDVSGIEMVEKVPGEVPVIVISRCPDDPRSDESLWRVRPAAVFRKPFSLGGLLRAVGLALPPG